MKANERDPGNPDVRIVARRSWGDDFAGCNVCNNVSAPSPAPAPIIYPTAALSSIKSTLSSGESTTITMICSEQIVGFNLLDINAQNGTISNFTTSDGITWSWTFTAGYSSATGLITIPANSFVNTAGNPNQTAITISIPIVAPGLIVD